MNKITKLTDLLFKKFNNSDKSLIYKKILDNSLPFIAFKGDGFIDIMTLDVLLMEYYPDKYGDDDSMGSFIKREFGDSVSIEVKKILELN